MRGENELQVTTDVVILLHLLDYYSFGNSPVVPFTVTQKGIAKTNKLTLSTVSRTLQKLKRMGYIDEKIAHVEGKKRRQKAYFLTREYLSLAKKMKDEMGEKKISLRGVDGEMREVKVSEINEHLEIKLSFPELIRRISDGVFDCKTIEKIAEEKEECTPVSSIPLTEKLRLDEDELLEGLSFQSKFVGRDKELSELKSNLDNAIKGHGRVVFIAGEAGIGKTRLVNELGLYARSKNIRFLVGRCLYQKGAIPYLPFIEALSNYSRVIKLSVDKEKPKADRGTQIWKSAYPQDEKARLFEELSHLIIDIANDKPLILFLDDLHWADIATLQLLHYVARSTRHSPVLICCAYRLEELSEIDGKTHPLIGTLQRMMKENLCSVIELERLGQSSAKEMIRSCFKERDLPEDFFTVIYEETEGNPFFIEEVVKSIQEGLSEVGIDEQWITSKIQIPKTVREVIERRVNMLDKTTKELLRYASVIGEEFDLDTLLHSMEINENDILDPVDKLLEAKLIYEYYSRDEEVYKFNHSLIQDVVYEGLSRVRKQLMHKQVADGLEKMHRHEIDKVVYDIAYHFSKSKDYEKTCRYSIEAGDKAVRIYALDDATIYYKMALDSLAELQDTKGNKQKKMDLLLKMGDTSDLIGKWDEALDYYQHSMRMGKEIGNDLGMAESYRRIGYMYRNKCEWDFAVKNFEKARRLSESIDDVHGMANACRGLGDVYRKKGQSEKAIKYCEECVNKAKKINNALEIAKAYITIGNIYRNKGKLDKALKYFKKSLEILEKINNMYEMAIVYNNLGTIYYDNGELDKAIEYIKKSIELSGKIGYIRLKAYGLCNIGEIYAKKLDLDKAKDCTDKALEFFKKIDDKIGISMSYQHYGIIYKLKKEWDKSIRYFKESINILEELDIPHELASTHLEFALMHKEKGNKQESKKYLEMASKLFKKLGAKKDLEECRKELKEI